MARVEISTNQIRFEAHRDGDGVWSYKVEVGCLCHMIVFVPGSDTERREVIDSLAVQPGIPVMSAFLSAVVELWETSKERHELSMLEEFNDTTTGAWETDGELLMEIRLL